MSSLLSVNPRLVFLLGFVLAVAAFMYRDRESIQRTSILFYRRTKSGIDKIESLAARFPRFWSIYGWAGVAVSILVVPLSLLMVKQSIEQAIATGGQTGGPSLIAPGISGEASFQSGISFIPAEYYIIGIGVLMAVHELSHGVVAAAEDMEINSVGWIVLGIIPGAFVEPKGEKMLPGDGSEDDGSEEDDDSEDEDRDGESQAEDGSSGGLWHQGTLSSRLKVLAAGSWANFLTAGLFTLTAVLLFSMVTTPVGVGYDASNGTAAERNGLDNGTIYEFNDQRVKYSDRLTELTSDIEPGEEVSLNTSEGGFSFEAGERNGSGHIGISMYRNSGFVPTLLDMVADRREIKPGYSSFEGGISWTLSLFQMVALLNVLIGLFNLLPAKPLDGGQMVGAVLDHFSERLGKAFNAWSLLVWAGILLSIVYSIAPI